MKTMDLITATEMLNNDLETVLSSINENINQCAMLNDNGEAGQSNEKLHISSLLDTVSEQLSSALAVFNVIRENQSALFSITQDLDIEVIPHR